MRVLLLVLLVSGWCRAEALLSDIDLSTGRWEMAAVSLHNYKPIVLQKKLRTFLVQNVEVLKEMQQTWNFEPFYDDNCDYHYALKFYKDNELQKTLLINLECGYISSGLFSYKFENQMLLKHRAAFKTIPWSFIRFSNIRQLRKAIRKIKPREDYFFYNDVKPFLYDGRFVVRTTGHSWNTDIDSVRNVLANYVSYKTGSTSFYIVSTVLFVDDSSKFTYRHEVYCNEDLANDYLNQDRRNLVAGWRSHFQMLNSKSKQLTLVVIGINKTLFWRLMRS